MLFTSSTFLFAFLPILLAVYYLCPRRHRNCVLFLASLLFYAWGQVSGLLLLLFSIGVNYLVGRGIDRAQKRGESGVRALRVGIGFNLLVLGIAKYTFFAVENVNWILGSLGMREIEAKPFGLILGISFFTFHAISYLVDIYRRRAAAQEGVVNYGLYIALFPQLIAGPIIRYRDIADQLTARRVTVADLTEGIGIFIVGLAKKLLLANILGVFADQAFSADARQLTVFAAWLGVLCYTGQIYFDFSGYSDMARGLCRLFGFRIVNNFNYPYVAQSVQEFWRRWHISLSNWFRDYLYIPLGGNRLGPRRTVANLFIVFLLCGLWHGAHWNFVLWGLYYGAFLAMERMPAAQGLLAALGEARTTRVPAVRRRAGLGAVQGGRSGRRRAVLPRHVRPQRRRGYGDARSPAGARRRSPDRRHRRNAGDAHPAPPVAAAGASGDGSPCVRARHDDLVYGALRSLRVVRRDGGLQSVHLFPILVSMDETPAPRSGSGNAWSSVRVAIFFVALVVPLAIMVSPSLRSWTGGRALAVPDWSWRVGDIKRFPDRFQEQFDAALPFRLDVAAFSRSVYVDGLGMSPVAEAILGTDGWLYYTGPAHERLSDRHVRGSAPFSPEELDLWRQRLIERTQRFRSVGAKYAFVIAPNKESIYPEHLPSGVGPSMGPTRLDQLMAHVKSVPDVTVIDLRPSLIAEKNDGRAVFQDGHALDRARRLRGLSGGDAGPRAGFPRACREVVARVRADARRAARRGHREDDRPRGAPGGRLRIGSQRLLGTPAHSDPHPRSLAVEIDRAGVRHTVRGSR